MKKNIVIIGAGPAGLTTAYQLLKLNKNDYNVTILESENMVGGISKTISLNSNYLADTGIHRFFSKNAEVNYIWNELLPIQSKPAYDDIVLNRNKHFSKTGSNPETDDLSMLIKDRLTRIYYHDNFFDYPVSLSFNTIKNLGFIKMIKILFSYLKACIFKKNEDSLENFYINRFGKELYKTFFKDYTTKVWGIDPYNISADWGAQRVKGISIFGIIKDMFNKFFKNKSSKNTETSLIEEFLYPKLGAGQMWSVMAEKITKMGGNIILNSKVIKINQKNNVISSIDYMSNNVSHTINLDILVSSMPIKDLFVSMGNENIDLEIYNAATNLPYRDFIVVYLVVNNLNLKNNTNIKTIGNIIPDDWIYIQDSNVKLGRIQIFNNWSPYLFKNKEDLANKILISLEYFASENDDLWNKSESEMIKFAENEAIKIGIIEKNHTIASKSLKISKAYPSYFGTYKDIDKIKKYLLNIENLYCVGRNGQHRYNNMDHSMLTGIETAKLIINNNSNKEKIWNVNTEKEYHEIKYEKDSKTNEKNN